MPTCCTRNNFCKTKRAKMSKYLVKWDGVQNHPILILMPTARFQVKMQRWFANFLYPNCDNKYWFPIHVLYFSMLRRQCCRRFCKTMHRNFNCCNLETQHIIISECAKVQRSTLWIDSSSLSADSVFGTWSVPGVNISLRRTMPFCA